MSPLIKVPFVTSTAPRLHLESSFGARAQTGSMPKSSTTKTEIRATLWGLAWWLWVASAIIWAAGLFGLSSELKNWPDDSVAVWSGDSHWFHPKWPMTEVFERQVEIRSHDGDAAYFSSKNNWPDSQLTLGRWQSENRSWSVCLWVLCTGEIAHLPRQVTIAKGQSREMSWKIDVQDGHFLAEEVSQSSSDFTYRRTAKSSLPLPLNSWRQLTIVSDDTHFTLYENGDTTANFNEGFPPTPHLTEITLHPYGIGSSPEEIALDEIILFDRAVSPVEAKLLFVKGRHGWENHVTLAKNYRRWLALGAVLGCATFFLAGKSSLAWLTSRSQTIAAAIRRPAYRPVLAVVLAGGIASTIVSWKLLYFAREDDNRYFTDQVNWFAENSDSHFEKIAM